MGGGCRLDEFYDDDESVLKVLCYRGVMVSS